MIKRILFYALCLTLVFIGVFDVYRNYKTEDIDSSPISTIKYDISEALSTNGLNTQIMNLKSDEYIYALFFDKDDINSQYMFNVTLSSIFTNYGIEKIENLTLVDISSLNSAARLNLRSRYGFSNAPALCKMHYADGSIVVDNVIQEDASTLLTESSVEKWLNDNKLLKEKK